MRIGTDTLTLRFHVPRCLALLRGLSPGTALGFRQVQACHQGIPTCRPPKPTCRRAMSTLTPLRMRATEVLEFSCSIVFNTSSGLFPGYAKHSHESLYHPYRSDFPRISPPEAKACTPCTGYNPAGSLLPCFQSPPGWPGLFPQPTNLTAGIFHLNVS